MVLKCPDESKGVQTLSPQLEVSPTNEKIKDLYGPNQSLLGECTVSGSVTRTETLAAHDWLVELVAQRDSVLVARIL